MKRFAFAAAVAALGALCVLPAQAGTAVVRSELDSNCHQAAQNWFVVPPGSTAKGFALNGVASGTNCTLAGGFDFEGFSIIMDANRPVTVYSYRHSNNTVWEDVNGASMGPHNGSEATALKTLTLGPGKYFVAVGGGRGAFAMLGYTMVP
jgi:hypothetical protein